MLPEPNYLPSHCLEAAIISCISAFGFGDLGLPPFRQLVSPFFKTPAMPEIAINEDSNAGMTKHKIRTARKITSVFLPAQALLV